ncbi:MAG: tetratricopeptide repeat protein [Streptomycetaceae bacterium]|jgi:putative thioredoxin|nr:tetratricopeptide repeat protein [Streptomycetaceae bacterium]
MSLPPNFGQAFDLSSLTKPKADPDLPLPGLEVTVENLNSNILPLSLVRPVIVLMWSPRSAESQAMITTLGKLEQVYEAKWSLARVNIDTHPEIAQAFQTKNVPYAVAIIAEQMVPLFEQAYPEAQVRLVIDKVLALSAQQGIGEAPVEQMEPEEEEAIKALESGEFAHAEAAYKKWLSRKPNENLAKLGLAQTQLLIRTEGLDLNQVIEESTKSPTDIDLQLRAADIEIVNGGVEAAFSRLLNLVKATQGDDKNKVKNHLLNLFALVDQSDPRLISARKELASSIF